MSEAEAALRRRFPSPPDAPPHLVRDGLWRGIPSRAIYSPCEVYRYGLIRVWDPAKPVWMYAMLNPSKATESGGDPTVYRQVNRVVAAGGGTLIVVNAGGLRETDRLTALRHADPVGPDNLFWIRHLAASAEHIVLAHGPDAARFGGDRVLREAFAGRDCLALKTTKAGWPGHPLYLGYALEPVPYAYPAVEAAE